MEEVYSYGMADIRKAAHISIQRDSDIESIQEYSPPGDRHIDNMHVLPQMIMLPPLEPPIPLSSRPGGGFHEGEGRGTPLTGTGGHSHDPLLVRFEQAFRSLPPSSSHCCIYRVPEKLRKVNPESYTPRVVSIGPFHSKAPHLEPMTQHKLRYMDAFLRRTNIILADYIEYVRTREQDIRNCYAESIEPSSDELVGLTLLDGCFIVELLLRYFFPQYIDESDRIFRKPVMIHDVLHDLILLENQIPFFVLEWIFNQVGFHYPGYLSIIDLVHHSLKQLVKMDECPTDSIRQHGVNHIVDFAWRYYLPKSQNELHVTVNGINEIPVPPSATELHEAGVKFAKKTSTTSSLVEVKFPNGCLEIPHFEVDDFTETLFRNLIAFEQCHDTDRYITQFIFLMDCFINTAKDVDLLTQNRVISCLLGSNEDISKLFNSLCKEVTFGNKSYYFDLCETLNAYCKTRWHRWKATLKRDYFKTPWSIASTIAAVTLLILTFMQTVCSFLQVT